MELSCVVSGPPHPHLTITWFFQERDEGTSSLNASSQVIHDGVKYYIEEASGADDVIMSYLQRSSTLYVVDFNANDSGYYWCQAVIPSSRDILLPSDPVLIDNGHRAFPLCFRNTMSTVTCIESNRTRHSDESNDTTVEGNDILVATVDGDGDMFSGSGESELKEEDDNTIAILLSVATVSGVLGLASTLALCIVVWKTRRHLYQSLSRRKRDETRTSDILPGSSARLSESQEVEGQQDEDEQSINLDIPPIPECDENNMENIYENEAETSSEYFTVVRASTTMDTHGQIETIYSLPESECYQNVRKKPKSYYTPPQKTSYHSSGYQGLLPQTMTPWHLYTAREKTVPPLVVEGEQVYCICDRDCVQAEDYEQPANWRVSVLSQ